MRPGQRLCPRAHWRHHLGIDSSDPTTVTRARLVSWATKRSLAKDWALRATLVDEDDLLDRDLALALARDPSIGVRKRLALRPDLPEAVLEVLRADPHEAVREALRGRPPGRAEGVTAPDCGYALSDLEGLAPEDGREIHRIAHGASLSATVANALLRLRPGDTTLAWVLAAQPELDALAIETIAALESRRGGHAGAGTWACIAKHPATPPAVLHEMVERGHAWCDTAAGHPNARPATVDLFLRLYPKASWRAVARREDLSATQIAVIARRYFDQDTAGGPSEWVLLARLARNAQAAAGMLRELGETIVAHQGAQRGRTAAGGAICALISNPATPVAVLEGLVFDCLTDRHRAMVLARVLGSDGQAEVAVELWDTLSGSVGEVRAVLEELAPISSRVARAPATRSARGGSAR